MILVSTLLFSLWTNLLKIYSFKLHHFVIILSVFLIIFPYLIVKLVLNTLYSINILKISATDFFSVPVILFSCFFCIYFVFTIICGIAAVLHEEKKPNKTLFNKQQGPPNQSCPIHRSHRWLEMSTELSCVYCLLLNTLNHTIKWKYLKY